MNDLTGAGWIEKNGTELLSTASFSPHAIDVDARGRIYFTSTLNSAIGKVYRINNFNDIPATISFGPGNGAYALAIDRTRNLVYFTNGSSVNTLYRCDYDGNSLTALTISLTNLTSLTVDQDTGMLYGIGSSGSPVIFKYDPIVLGFIKSVPLTVGGSTYLTGDVMAKNSNIYIALYDQFNTLQAKIVVMNSELALTGTELLQSPTGDPFTRPTHFLPLINRKYFICDENGSMNNDRIVGFDDMSGTGWQTFKANDIGSKTGFQFYYFC